MAASVAGIQTLAQQLQADPVAHANNAIKLLQAVEASKNDAVSRAAIQALKLFFLSAYDSGDLRSKRRKLEASGSAGAQAETSAEAVFQQWLQRQLKAFVHKLTGLLEAPAPAAVQVSAFAALMECVRVEEPGVFANELFSDILSTLLTSRHAKPEVLAQFLTKHLPYADVRLYTLRTLTQLASKHAIRAAPQQEHSDSEEEQQEQGQQQQASSVGAQSAVSSADLARSMYDVMSRVAPSTPADVSELASWCGAAEEGVVTAANDAAASAKARRKRKQQQQQQQQGPSSGALLAAAWANAKVQQRAFSEAWLAVLRLDLPADVLRKVLIALPRNVIPHLLDPLLLSDFLTHALDAPDPLSAMLALNGIFILVTQHGLEYPAFYRRLYGLLAPQAFLSSNRAQFFKLADIFLASALVPAYTAAAFAKRFARLALRAPPAGALIALAFIHNIIRRHPSIFVLLHRPTRPAAAAAAAAAAGDEAGATGGVAAAAGREEVAAASGADGDSEHHAAPRAVHGVRMAGVPTVAANGDAPFANGDTSSADEQQEQQAHQGQQQQRGQQQQQQQQQQQEAEPRSPGHDPYDECEPDPAKCRAVESSLWELTALRNHSCPQVASFVSILDKDLSNRTKTAEVDLEPLLASSYASLFKQEAERRLKSVPLAAYAAPPQQLLGTGGALQLMGWDME